MIISSQRYLEEAVVKEKQDARDYIVMLTPDFVYDGHIYAIIVDGHHSLEAAQRDKVEPEYTTADGPNTEYTGLDAQALLDACYIDSPYYDIQTGDEIW